MSDTLTQLLALLQPTILSVISTVIGVVLLRLSVVAKERWNIEIEARLREALQSALMTGIQGALQKGMGDDDAIKAAVQHVITVGAPKAVEAFDLSPDKLAEMAGGKLHSALKDRRSLASAIDGAMSAYVSPTTALQVGDIDQSIVASLATAPIVR